MTNPMVLAFAFSPTMEEILLIHKLKPDFQRSKWNGIGGKVESTDISFATAMTREFKEETGIDVDHEKWKFVINMTTLNSSWSVICHAIILTPDQWKNARSQEAECIEKIKCNSLPENIMPNLNWLIPMAKNALLQRDMELNTVTYYQ